MAYIVVLRPAEEDRGAAASPFPGLIGRSPAMERVFRLIENLEHSEATVLLTGESGTGKEVVARAIHAHSPRRGGPFVAVNCGALPESCSRASSSATCAAPSPAPSASAWGASRWPPGGTLFLDEIGDLPLHLQVKLLRVLQERTFERVGESQPRRTDVRVIAATNGDLRARRAGGPLPRGPLLPPARRADRAPARCASGARTSSRSPPTSSRGWRRARAGRCASRPTRCARCSSYAWPGNVRELENALEYAVAVCQGQTILPEDLPVEVASRPRDGPAASEAAVAVAPPGASRPAGAQPADTQAVDVARIRGALEACRWRRHEAARLSLGVSRTTLWRHMRELPTAPENNSLLIETFARKTFRCRNDERAGSRVASQTPCSSMPLRTRRSETLGFRRWHAPVAVASESLMRQRLTPTLLEDHRGRGRACAAAAGAVGSLPGLRAAQGPGREGDPHASRPSATSASGSATRSRP